MKNKTVKLLMHVLENKKFSGGRFCECEVLNYPSLDDENFNTIDLSLYEWEDRSFEYPLFTDYKKGEFFVVEVFTSKKESYIKVFEHLGFLRIGKMAYRKHDLYIKKAMKETFKRLFKTNKLKKTINI